jgi:hypothetical protein
MNVYLEKGKKMKNKKDWFEFSMVILFGVSMFLLGLWVGTLI